MIFNPVLFVSERVFYPEYGRWGYKVYEIGDGIKVPVIISPARYWHVRHAGLAGFLEAEKLKRLCLSRNVPTCKESSHAM